MTDDIEQAVARERDYERRFGALPEMPRPMPPEEFDDLVKAALESGMPIQDDTPPEALT